MRSISEKFPLPFAAVEVVVDILRHSFLSVTTEVKLPLRDDIVGVIAVVGNQGDLSDVSRVCKNNVTRTNKRVSQAASVFLCDEVVPQFV